MAVSSPSKAAPERVSSLKSASPILPVEIAIALFTGGIDRHYAFGLATALAAKGVCLDVIGSPVVDSPEMHTTPCLSFFNLEGNPQTSSGLIGKICRILVYYVRLIRYAYHAKPTIFHILWNYKFEFFDRTLLMLYYKILGKKIVLTVHNVNAGRRDSNDSWLNRITLRMQYRIADHLFVHTNKMKQELLKDFVVRREAVSVIPYGINNSVPDTNLTPAQAKQRLGISENERTILFFGAIRPYKGLEYLVAAFQKLAASQPGYRLIIGGEPKKDTTEYFEKIQWTINHDLSQSLVIQKIQCIPDEEVELYFKAADVLVLPYREIFQSGVLFLGFNFGLPAIASDVGSFREEIMYGENGYLCRPNDAADLASVIGKYFESNLFQNLETRRQKIRDYANAQHSWEFVGDISLNIYQELQEEKK